MKKIWYDVEIPTAVKIDLQKHVSLIGPLIGPDKHDKLTGLEFADAAIVSAGFPAKNQATFDRAKNLKLLTRVGIGYDSVDLDLATISGICVTNTPDAPTEATAEFAINLMLALMRPVRQSNQMMKSGLWQRSSEEVGTELADKTLGIIGFGRIGRRVAEIALAFRMQVIVYDPFVDSEVANSFNVNVVNVLHPLYKASDIISLHVPLCEETYGLIDKNALSQMKKGAVVINVSRGPVVVEPDLFEALNIGHIGGAGIDVWNPEPPASDHPLVKLDNVIATPHIAAMSKEMLHKSYNVALKAFMSLMNGERPDNLLNPNVWEHRRL